MHYISYEDVFACLLCIIASIGLAQYDRDKKLKVEISLSIYDREMIKNIFYIRYRFVAFFF